MRFSMLWSSESASKTEDPILGGILLNVNSVLSVEDNIAFLISEKVLYGDGVAFGRVVSPRRARGIFGSPIMVGSCSEVTLQVKRE